jgi:ribosomal-protein-alanine N-acetyltransferase
VTGSPEALAALHARCFTSPRPWSADEFAALLREPAVFLLGGAHGFALGRVLADEAELLTIAVAPEARGRGLGHRLMEAFEAEAARRGATRAFLEVAEDNDAALRLYRARGYGESGRRRGYYRRHPGPAADALVMARDLSPG